MGVLADSTYWSILRRNTTGVTCSTPVGASNYIPVSGEHVVFSFTRYVAGEGYASCDDFDETSFIPETDQQCPVYNLPFVPNNGNAIVNPPNPGKKHIRLTVENHYTNNRLEFMTSYCDVFDAADSLVSIVRRVARENGAGTAAVFNLVENEMDDANSVVIKSINDVPLNHNKDADWFWVRRVPNTPDCLMSSQSYSPITGEHFAFVYQSQELGSTLEDCGEIVPEQKLHDDDDTCFM